MSRHQAESLGFEKGRLLSPYLQLCCLRMSANVSYANAEADVALLTGMQVSANTQQRLVQGYEFPEPQLDSPIHEACVDGGKVRIRTPIGNPCVWRDYKAVATEPAIIADLQNNQHLIKWVNAQPKAFPLNCLGDGHDGVWNIIDQFASAPQRREILDWYHLKENLYKVGGSLKRLCQAEALLWQGQLDQTMALFVGMKQKQAKNFCQYLEKHRHRIVNYAYYQAEDICSIGSGKVESAIKQIDRRTKISGAQWKAENVPQVLAHRTAYLNGLFSLKR